MNKLAFAGYLSEIEDPVNAEAISDLSIFEQHESNVRCYCRSFPKIFTRAKGALLYSASGRRYIDFFAGAGALNYGHNNDFIKGKLISYLQSDGIGHGLDFHTEAKRNFIETFYKLVLEPRGLDYKLQFCGPTGTNSVEAAMKLARKVTGRPGIFAFMGGFHGMSLGSLAASGNRGSRAVSGIQLGGVNFMPYPHDFMASFDSIGYMDTVLSDTHSGTETPAAVIVETVQAEGGVVVAPIDWLKRLRKLCDRYGILLICDDIQVGCHRTGPFFSFEHAGIIPDIVTLSKSIGGYGTPMSLVLLKPELDVWKPGEHTGTFRGNQLAFIGGAAALEYARLWTIEVEVKRKEEMLRTFLTSRIAAMDSRLIVRGLGMIWGVDFTSVGGAQTADRISASCFKKGLIIETAGRGGAVVKFLPPLTIEDNLLQEGFALFESATKECLHV